MAATKLDNVEGNSPEEKKARKRNEMRLYDRRLLEERLKHLREVRERGQISEMMFAVRADLLRNLGNMTNRSVFVLNLSGVGKRGEAVHDETGRNVCLDLPHTLLYHSIRTGYTGHILPTDHA